MLIPAMLWNKMSSEGYYSGAMWAATPENNRAVVRSQEVVNADDREGAPQRFAHWKLGRMHHPIDLRVPHAARL